MSECVGKYFIEDGSLKESALFDNTRLYEGELIYEVIRVIDSVPLFFSDHAGRLFDSVKLSGRIPLAGEDDILANIMMLIGSNNICAGNIKICFLYNGPQGCYMAYFIESQYPDEHMYDRGVDTILFEAERRNPSAKVFNFRLRSTILDILLHKGAYEALLVNRRGCITEGSRSNVFFIRDNRVITAGDKAVLGGITRKYVIRICNSEGVAIDYRCLQEGELQQVDAVFISGTSPQVLPVRTIGSISYNVDHPLLRMLYLSYTGIVKAYIESHRQIDD